MPPPRRPYRAKPLAEFLPDTLDPLVARLGIGVHEGANVDAPSSLAVRELTAQRMR